MILAALAMHYMNHHPKYSTIAYCISQLLDAVDGHAARYLGQASKFGAVLDMVTDRYLPTSLFRILILTIRVQQGNHKLPAMLSIVGISTTCPHLPIPYRPRL